MTPFDPSSSFYLGLALLLVFQGSQFFDLGREDVADENLHMSGLRASDYVSTPTFYTALVVYLVVSALVYWLTCWLSPSILQGWIRLGGNSAEPGQPAELPYELGIAAIYMGLSHPNVPILSGLSKLQRTIFHHFIGIPHRVEEASELLSSELIDALGGTDDTMADRVRYLADESWRARIGPYADTRFFYDRLRSYRLDSAEEMQQIVSGSERELKIALRRLVLISAIATTRKSGGSGLRRLAKDLLDKDIPAQRSPLASIMGFFLVATFAGLAIVLFTPSAPDLLGFAPSAFWPSQVKYALIDATLNVLPIVLAVSVTLERRPVRKVAESAARGQSLLEENGRLYFALYLIVLLLQIVATLFSLGYFSTDTWSLGGASANPYRVELLAFSAFRSFIPVFVCHGLLTIATLRLAPAAAETRKSHATEALWLAYIAAVSCGYALAYIGTFFPDAPSLPLDFALFVALLNVVTAWLSFRAAATYYGGPRAAPGRATAVAAAA